MVLQMYMTANAFYCKLSHQNMDRDGREVFFPNGVMGILER